MLSDQLVLEIGVNLGQRFTQSDLESLCDLLSSAARGCDYAAEDYAERAHYERNHCGDEEAAFTEVADSYSAISAKLGELISAIEVGERLGREDHPL